MKHEILTVHPPMVFPSLSFFGGSRAFLRFFARLAYVACSCNLACFSFSFTGSLRGNQVLFRFCGSARFRPSAAKYFIRAGSLKSAEERYSSDNALAFSASVMMDNWYSSYRNIFLQKWTNTFQLVTNSGRFIKPRMFFHHQRKETPVFHIKTETAYFMSTCFLGSNSDPANLYKDGFSSNGKM